MVRWEAEGSAVMKSMSTKSAVFELSIASAAWDGKGGWRRGRRPSRACGGGEEGLHKSVYATTNVAVSCEREQKRNEKNMFLKDNIEETWAVGKEC